MGPVRLISTTSYFYRNEISGYDGTLYNLGYYQSQIPTTAIPQVSQHSLCSTDRVCTCPRG